MRKIIQKITITLPRQKNYLKVSSTQMNEGKQDTWRCVDSAPCLK